jgi:hypothetical protein
MELMDLSKLSRDDRILAGLALLLAIDLLFLPWWSASGVFGGLPNSGTATGFPSGWLGVLGLLAALAVIADVVLEHFSSVELPALGGSRSTTRLALAEGAGLCLALKFLFHVSFTSTYWDVGFWAAVVLTVALVMVASRVRDADHGRSAAARS